MDFVVCFSTVDRTFCNLRRDSEAEPEHRNASGSKPTDH